ncbi:unnamed protein product [Amoebophrya sp. A25]|nr:unnamed protein product [Amoebophrya sp. A25]|eukprot:GSA25T00014744001.1
MPETGSKKCAPPQRVRQVCIGCVLYRSVKAVSEEDDWTQAQAQGQSTSAYEVLVGKRLNSHGAGCWALPGGHLEWGETWQQCAAREVREETAVSLPEDSFHLTCVSNDRMLPEKPQEGAETASVCTPEKHYVTPVFTQRALLLLTYLFMASSFEGHDESEIENLEPHKCEGWHWMTLEKAANELSPLFLSLEHLLAQYKEGKWAPTCEICS